MCMPMLIFDLEQVLWQVLGYHINKMLLCSSDKISVVVSHNFLHRVYILSVRVLSSFAPIAKGWFMPSHAFPDWQECTSTYEDKHYVSDFQALGCQPSGKISCICAVSLRNREEWQKHDKYSFRSAPLPYTCNTFLPTREGVTWCESRLHKRHEWAKRSHR